MTPTERIRPRSSQALGAAMVLVAVLGLGSALAGGSETILRYAAPVTLFGLLGWAAFWQPYVEISDGGVTLSNVVRTVQVPWPAVEEVDGRYGLRLRTAYGTVTGWAATAPRGRDRRQQQPGATARAVTERLDALRAEGHLENRRLEAPRLTTTWHVPVVTAVGLLVCASVLLPLLA